MLNSFDWLRLSQTGAELLSTLRYLNNKPNLPQRRGEIGPPHSALDGPCQRCWVYPRAQLKSRGKKANIAPRTGRYCEFCQTVINKSRRLGQVSRDASVIWGFVNHLPERFYESKGFSEQHLHSVYIHDERHFLLMIPKRYVRDWLHELVLYYGSDLTGIIQIFTTVGIGQLHTMGGILSRIVDQDVHYAVDQLRVRFYAASYQVIRSHIRERQGILTFEVAEFLHLLEMAAVFRLMLRPDIQEVLYQLLNLKDAREEAFYWGRFLGMLSPEAKDMLNAWKIRTWSKERIKLLYELTDYVYVDFSRTP
ncbi:MAG: hypothetical protein KKD28_07115 [Chloroflexi bacterium]|nr:hypothetical protein [Chloroflexota bacterium]MBU1661226.1 hypothetical protein [Chloroflexota bacterium]